MKRHLTARNVFLLSAAGTISAGIFYGAGAAAANYAGPAVILAFVVVGFTSMFVGLCYCELATAIPAIGSVYVYAFSTGGELFAFVAGWTAIAQYVTIAATAATSLTSHLGKLVELATDRPAGVTLTQSPLSYSDATGFHRSAESNGILNLPAVAAVILCTFAMCFGIKRSAHISHVLTGIALIVFLALVIVIATGYDSFPYLSPFVPGSDMQGAYGIRGVFQAAASIAFVCFGIDSAANCVQEVQRPARDIPIGIIGSILFSIIVYVLTYGGVLGVTPFKELKSMTPLADASFDIFRALGWFVCVAGLTGLASVIIVSLIALPRILCSMAQDGLVGAMFGHIDRKSGTPIIPTLACGALIAIMAGLFPLGLLGNLASAATLMSFTLVAASACILRFKHPDVHRPFTFPLGPVVVPAVAGTCSLGLLVFCRWENVVRLLVWVCIGMGVYFGWSVKHSVLRTGEPVADVVSETQATRVDMVVVAATKADQGGEPMARAYDGK
ncbi:amino acid/polyamine transporter I, partial [Catenaria anguillulae PL171]